MTGWTDLANDMKMCVMIYREAKAGRRLWFTKLAELLKDDMSRLDISMLEDKLQDIGVLYKKYHTINRIHSCCFFIEDDALGFIENVSENLTGYPITEEGGG